MVKMMIKKLYSIVHRVVGSVSIVLLVLILVDFSLITLGETPPWRETETTASKPDSGDDPDPGEPTREPTAQSTDAAAETALTEIAVSEPNTVEPTGEPSAVPATDTPVELTTLPELEPPAKLSVAPSTETAPTIAPLSEDTDSIQANYFDLGGEQEPTMVGFLDVQQAPRACDIGGFDDTTIRSASTRSTPPFTTIIVPSEQLSTTLIAFCFTDLNANTYFEIWLGGTRPESMTCAGTAMYTHSSGGEDVGYREFLIPAECVLTDEVHLVFMNQSQNPGIGLFGILVATP